MLSSLDDSPGAVGTQRHVVGAKLLAQAWITLHSCHISHSSAGRGHAQYSTCQDLERPSPMAILQGQRGISVSQMNKLRPGSSA